MLTQNKQKLHKTYVKKLKNGYGIRRVNTITGVENIIVITTDTTSASDPNKKSTCKVKVLNPTSNNVRATLPKLGSDKQNLVKNTISAQVNPYLQGLYPNISGFHMFEFPHQLSHTNTQETSVIFVANTELAKEEGVHFDVPCKLINSVITKSNDQNKTQFLANPNAKPLKIIISDYVIHVDLNYDLPANNTSSTQTQNDYVLISSDINCTNNHGTESEKSFKVKKEHKSIQTDGNCLSSENQQSSQTNLNKLKVNCSTQTMSSLVHGSHTSTADFNQQVVAGIDEHCLLRKDTSNESCNQCLESLNQLANKRNLVSSLTSCESHSKTHSSLSSHIQNYEDKQYYESSDKMNTILTNQSNITLGLPHKISTCKHQFQDKNVCYSTESKSTKFSSNINSSKTTTNHTNTYDLMKSDSSNISIKEIKQRMNKTTASLYELYSVVEFMERRSGTESTNERTYNIEDSCSSEELLNPSLSTNSSKDQREENASDTKNNSINEHSIREVNSDKACSENVKLLENESLNTISKDKYTAQTPIIFQNKLFDSNQSKSETSSKSILNENKILLDSNSSDMSNSSTVFTPSNLHLQVSNEDKQSSRGAFNGIFIISKNSSVSQESKSKYAVDSQTNNGDSTLLKENSSENYVSLSEGEMKVWQDKRLRLKSLDKSNFCLNTHIVQDKQNKLEKCKFINSDRTCEEKVSFSIKNEKKYLSRFRSVKSWASVKKSLKFNGDNKTYISEPNIYYLRKLPLNSSLPGNQANLQELKITFLKKLSSATYFGNRVNMIKDFKQDYSYPLEDSTLVDKLFNNTKFQNKNSESKTSTIVINPSTDVLHNETQTHNNFKTQNCKPCEEEFDNKIESEQNSRNTFEVSCNCSRKKESTSFAIVLNDLKKCQNEDCIDSEKLSLGNDMTSNSGTIKSKGGRQKPKTKKNWVCSLM